MLTVNRHINNNFMKVNDLESFLEMFKDSEKNYLIPFENSVDEETI